eukprot:1140007-Pelagomonas_calceolata.AAC.1
MHCPRRSAGPYALQSKLKLSLVRVLRLTMMMRCAGLFGARVCLHIVPVLKYLMGLKPIMMVCMKKYALRLPRNASRQE